MKHCVVIFLGLSACVLAQGVNVTGTVVNQHEIPVESLTVTLLDAGLSETTDENGEFHLSGSTLASGVVAGQRSVPAIQNGRISFSVARSGQPVSVELFDLKGAKTATIVDKQFAAGEHRIPIQKDVLHRGASSILVLVVKKGGELYKFKLMRLGSGIQPVAELVSMNTQTPAKRASGKALDQIEIRRRGEIEATIDVDNLIDDLSIMLDLVPYEIVEIAVAENGNYPDEVGQDGRVTNPGPIADFLDKTGSGDHDYEAWCSEFVSWCCRAAGYPLVKNS
ncbi:MAG: hypothetical protein GF350_05650, partial [Chitinivibrionales bacterium]|nr:hypothetical protein [Chitinivibrionales bacterium]